MKLYEGVSNYLLCVDDIENLSDAICRDLQVGDTVVERNEAGEEFLWKISYKENYTLQLTFACDNFIDNVYYSFNDVENEWYFEGRQGYLIPAEDKYGLELIEWDGERDFSEEEVTKLLTGKVGVKIIDGTDEHIYLPDYIYNEEGNEEIYLNNIQFADDGIENGAVEVLIITHNGSYDTYNYLFEDLKGTKLYKHTLEDSEIGYVFYLITNDKTPLDFTNLDTQKKIAQYLFSLDFYILKNHFSNQDREIVFDIDNEYFCDIYVSNGSVKTSNLDDWDLSTTTDTVEEL